MTRDRTQTFVGTGRTAAIAALAAGLLASPAFASENAEARAPTAGEIQQYCANVAASAEAIRIERRKAELTALQGEINTRLQQLDAKQQELRAALDRLEAFEKKTSETLIGVYSRMKPEAAAAQITQLDNEIAAALLLQLKAKVSSAILGEMEASQGAALAKRIAELKQFKDGKNP